MQSDQSQPTSKCLLESPKRSYDSLLLYISHNLCEKDKDDFVFVFRSDLPRSVLESRKPLQWFMELEQREMLSPANLDKLKNFLLMVSLNVLEKQVVTFQAKQSVIMFFQRKLGEKIPELSLDQKFSESWMSGRSLPKHFLRKVHPIFREIVEATEQNLEDILNKGVTLLVNSCQSRTDLETIALKILHLSKLVSKRFGELLIKNNHLRERLSSGFARGIVEDDVWEERLPANPPEHDEPQIEERQRGNQIIRGIHWYEIVEHLVMLCIVCVSLMRVFSKEMGLCTTQK